MLSALVIAADARVPVSASPEAVVRTLASLVPAAIEGVVRDVVLAGLAGQAELRSIVDHAGCELAVSQDPASTIGEGLRRARGDVLLVLRAGRAPERGLFEELTDLSEDLRRLRALRIRAAPEGLATRLMPGLAPAAGLVAVRSALPGEAADLEALIRAVRPRNTLRARLRRVGSG